MFLERNIPPQPATGPSGFSEVTPGRKPQSPATSSSYCCLELAVSMARRGGFNNRKAAARFGGGAHTETANPGVCDPAGREISFCSVPLAAPCGINAESVVKQK